MESLLRPFDLCGLNFIRVASLKEPDRFIDMLHTPFIQIHTQFIIDE